MANLRILYWNACGISKIAALRATLKEENADVVLVNETLLAPSDSLRLPGYHVFRQDERSSEGRVYRGLAVLMRRRIVHQPCPRLHLQTLYALGVEVFIAGQPLCLYAAYKAPHVQLHAHDVHDALALDEDNTTPTLLAGDFNAKHRAWNSTTDYTDGRRLFNDAEARGYCVEGPETPTHYPDNPQHQPSVIDIAVHRGLPGPLTQEVLFDDMGSDHLPVIAVLAIAPVCARTLPPRRSVDWDAFAYMLEAETSSRPVTTAQDVDLLSVELTTVVKNALDSCSSAATAFGRRRPDNSKGVHLLMP